MCILSHECVVTSVSPLLPVFYDPYSERLSFIDKSAPRNMLIEASSECLWVITFGANFDDKRELIIRAFVSANSHGRPIRKSDACIPDDRDLTLDRGVTTLTMFVRRTSRHYLTDDLTLKDNGRGGNVITLTTTLMCRKCDSTSPGAPRA